MLHLARDLDRASFLVWLSVSRSSLCVSVQGNDLDLAITKEEVEALIGEGKCTVKTLTRNHLYCEPPTQQPSASPNYGNKKGSADALPEFIVSLPNILTHMTFL